MNIIRLFKLPQTAVSTLLGDFSECTDIEQSRTKGFLLKIGVNWNLTHSIFVRRPGCNPLERRLSSRYLRHFLASISKARKGRADKWQNTWTSFHRLASVASELSFQLLNTWKVLGHQMGLKKRYFCPQESENVAIT